MSEESTEAQLTDASSDNQDPAFKPAENSGLLDGLNRFRDKQSDPEEGYDESDPRDEGLDLYEEAEGFGKDKDGKKKTVKPKEDEIDDFTFDDIFSGEKELEQFSDDDEGSGLEGDESEKAEDDKGGEAGSDPDDIDIEALTTEEGKPISKKAKEAFSHLKESNKKLKEQLTEFEKEKENLVPTDDYKKASEEARELRKQLDLLDFRSSADFKKQYDEPIEAAIKESVRWIGTIPEGYHNDAKKDIQKANTALANGSEAAFFAAVDNIHENYLTGSRGARFVASMNKLWDAQEAKNVAEKDMEKARNDIVAARQRKAESSERLIEATVASALDNYQKENKSVIDFYRSDRVKDTFKIDQVMQEAPKRAMKLLNDFLASGRVDKELSDIILAGSMDQVRNTERQLLLSSIQNFQRQLNEREKEIQAHKGKLKNISSRRGSYKQTSDDDEDIDSSSGDDFDEYGIVSGIRKIRNG